MNTNNTDDTNMTIDTIDTMEEVNLENFENIQSDTELFNEVMTGIFLKGPYFEKSIELLSTGTIDINHHDNQLFRELNVGRLGTTDTLKIFKILIDKYNYVMSVRDITQIMYYRELYKQ